MPPGILATVNLKSQSGLEKDTVVNTFAFASDLTIAQEHAAITSRLQDFYNGQTGGGDKIASYISPGIARASKPVEVKYYDISAHLDGSPHGSPVVVDTFVLAALPGGTNTPMPEEVAMCLSFHSAYDQVAEFGSHTRPRARDRGRVFVGPLTVLAMGLDAGTGQSRPAGIIPVTIAQAATRLCDPTSTALWSVWSRKNAALTSVVGGWVDNAWDTQRRRGYKPTSREMWLP